MATPTPALPFDLVEYDRPEIEAGLVASRIDLTLLLSSNLKQTGSLTHETLLRARRQLWLTPDHPLVMRSRISLAEVAEQD